MFYDQSGLAVAAPPPDVPELMGIQSEYVQTQCILADGGDRFGVSALAFDRYEELLWMGNQGGHVTSYYTGALQKYTSFQIHATEDVRQVLTINEGILGLTASSLRYQIRRGIPVFTHTSANMFEMQCMLQLGTTRLLMGGHHGKLIDFNIDLCKEMQVVDVGDPGCVMLRPHSRFICAGNPVGRIDLRDPNSLNIEHTLETHSGSLSDFDVQGNLLVTCGFSNSYSRHGNLTVDRFLMVYDLRMMRAVTPIQTVLDPLYLRFLPSVSSRLAVVSALGHAQVLDTVAFAEPRLCIMQMDSPGTMCLTFDISATSQAFTFGDSNGSIHLFSSTPQPLFNTYSRMTEHGDPLVTYPSFAIDDYDTPLSVIPMPINHDSLSSDWPEHLTKKCYRRPVGIDSEVLRTMKMKGSIGYAPNSRTWRRNQVMYEIDNRLRSQTKHDGRNNKSDEPEGFIAIPKRYRKIDVKYNKLGTDECQFDQFNKTGHTGLEATLPNAYCNAMIQVLYFIEPIRAVLLSHLCNKEFCLSCELGFLFHMLKTSSNNWPCQPANFLRAFRTIPEASALSLVYSDLPPDQKVKINLGALIQSWNRFIIHQLHVELAEAKKKNAERKNNKIPFSYNVTDFPAIDDRTKRCSASEVNANIEQEKKDSQSEIIQLIGAKQMQIHTCLKCKLEMKKESILLVCNLIYPTNEPDRDEWSFCDILARSLCSQQTTPAWCEECRKFSPTQQRRVLQSLPKLLAINTGLHNPQHKQFWQSQMDKVVAKVTNSETSAPQTTPHNNSLSSSKPCRYGDHCSRPGCRFRHSFDNVPPPAPVNNPYCSNNWLPHSISIALNDRDLLIEKIEKNQNPQDGILESEKSEDYCKKLYDLTAVVCYINDPSSSEKRNIVALINVPDSYVSDSTNSEHKWYLFNDFSISPVSAQEAVWFSLDWKIPCILYYSTREIIESQSGILPPISKEVFTEDACIARSWGTSGITFTPLTDNEFPKKGDLVAMDAEFVTLNQEEAELRSDGKMSMIKPSQMSVARITCIRGSGSMEGVPFIDDYISTQEQVVDYLTKFSGIKPGDLDANFSSKHLTTLKSTYTKLRFLLDNGVIFVGHGLKNDFRVINLVVPPEQVADTVHLFHLPHHRMVSLRFLAWHFLGVKIQSETHDSVEDARAALHLYKKYKQLEAQHKVGEALAELYDRGKLLNWKVPEDT